MDPAYDKVGLVAFPPGNGGHPCTFDPKTTNGPTTDYDPYPNGYQPGAAVDQLQGVGHGAVERELGARVHGQLHQGGRHDATSAAIDKAKQTLAASHDPEAQDVIIFFTDGEANYGACTIANNNGVCGTNNTSLTADRDRASRRSTSADARRRCGHLGLRDRLRHAEHVVLGLEVQRHRHRRQACAKQNGLPVPCAEVPAITATPHGAGSRLRSDEVLQLAEPRRPDRDLQADRHGSHRGTTARRRRHVDARSPAISRAAQPLTPTTRIRARRIRSSAPSASGCRNVRRPA